MATALCTTLAGCGGGGGGPGGAVGEVQEWVNDDLSNLVGAESNIGNWYNIIQSFNTSMANGSSIQSILTEPSTEDREKAQYLLTLLQDANNAWIESNSIIDDLSDSEKYEKLNSDAYKKAYRAIQFLNNNVKPLIQKVANGNSLSITEYTSMDTKA